MNDMNVQIPAAQVSNSDMLSEGLGRKIKGLHLQGDWASKSLSDAMLLSNQVLGTSFLFQAQTVTTDTLRSAKKFT